MCSAALSKRCGSGFRSLLVVLAFMGLNARYVRAEVLLEIDVSNPSAVVFTATDAFSAQNHNSATTYDGISILNFFTSNSAFIDYNDQAVPGDWAFVSSDLSPSGTADLYDSIGTFNIEVSTSWAAGNDLCINGYQKYSTQVFSTSQTAFTGSAVKDMAGGFQDNSAYLPAVGTMGDIIVGYEQSNPVIGQWQIVPEPSSIGLILVGGLGLVRCRRKRGRF